MSAVCQTSRQQPSRLLIPSPQPDSQQNLRWPERMFLGFTLPTPLSPTATTLREMQTSKFESLTIVAPPLLSPPFYYRAVQLTFQKFRQGVSKVFLSISRKSILFEQKRRLKLSTLLVTTVTEVSPSRFVVCRRSGDRRAAI